MVKELQCFNNSSLNPQGTEDNIIIAQAEMMENVIHSEVLLMQQICDKEMLPGKVKYYAAKTLRSILTNQPQLLKVDHYKQILLVCLITVLKKFNIQHFIKDLQLLDQLLFLEEKFKDKLEYHLISLTLERYSDSPSPFDHVETLKDFNFSSQELKSIQNLIDFTLCLSESYQVNSQMVMLACLSIFLQNQPKYKVLQSFLELRLTIESLQLRQMIKNVYKYVMENSN